MDFLSPATMPPTAGYSHLVRVDPGSSLVFVSGQVGVDPTGRPAEGWEAQTRATFDNLGQALRAADATWSDVVKLTFFLLSTEALPVVRAIRDEYVDTNRPPASSLVCVAGLFRPELLIEVEAIAAVPTAIEVDQLNPEGLGPQVLR